MCLSCTDAGWSALNGSWLPEDSPATLCRRTLGGPPVLATQRQPGSVGLAQATDALARASRDFHSALVRLWRLNAACRFTPVIFPEKTFCGLVSGVQRHPE